MHWDIVGRPTKRGRFYDICDDSEKGMVNSSGVACHSHVVEYLYLNHNINRDLVTNGCIRHDANSKCLVQ